MSHTNQQEKPSKWPHQHRDSDIPTPGSYQGLDVVGPGWYGPNSNDTDVICYGTNANSRPATNGNAYAWFNSRAIAQRAYVRSGGQSRVRRKRSQSKRTRSRGRSRKNGRGKK